MKQEFYNLQINTNGHKLYEFTDQTIQWINDNHLVNGMLNLSIQHTSASLIVQENADPDVQTDLIKYFDKLAPMDNKLYIHTTEGKDDMPAHIKSALTNSQISLMGVSCAQNGLKFGNTILVSKQLTNNKMTQISINGNTILLNEDFTNIIYVNDVRK